MFHLPCGTLASSLMPRRAHPRSGAMLVRLQVSSMKTKRSGSIPGLIRRPLRPPSRHVGTIALTGDDGFFEAQLLGVNEVPHRVVVDLETAIGKLSHQPTQRKVLLLGPCQEPGAMLAPDLFRFVPTHLARRNAARLPNRMNHGCRTVRLEHQLALVDMLQRPEHPPFSRPKHPARRPSGRGVLSGASVRRSPIG